MEVKACLKPAQAQPDGGEGIEQAVDTV